MQLFDLILIFNNNFILSFDFIFLFVQYVFIFFQFFLVFLFMLLDFGIYFLWKLVDKGFVVVGEFCLSVLQKRHVFFELL